MSLFRNLNFVDNISTQQGIPNFPSNIGSVLQGLVENQTRKLLETGFKVMTQNHRQQLQIADLETALNILNLNSIILIPGEDKFEALESGYLRADKAYVDCEQFIRQELKEINHTFEKPQIRGRWIMFQNVIPKIHQNQHIKNYNEILELQENEFKERNKMFNVIRDQPLNVLSLEEQDFFREATVQLEQGIVPSLDHSNPERVLQMFIWYMNSTEITDSLILFLFDILRNIQNKQKIEPYLYSILIILMSYEGHYCFEAGIEIGKLIEMWGDRYPKILEILHTPAIGCYYTKIKLLAVEQRVNINLNISTQRLEEDLMNKVPMAKEFYYLIHSKNRQREVDTEKYRERLEETMTVEEEIQNLTL